MLTDDARVGDRDLDAYVDDQLDEAQRARVEAYLATRPQAAARVMQDLALRRDLRRALAPPAPPPALRGAARRLSRAQRRDDRMRRVLRVVPAAMLVGLGWLAHAGLGPLSVSEGTAAVPAPPPVTAALSAHQVSMLRLGMSSQPEVSALDPEEMRAATGIVLPRFPRAWTVRDAQVFPSPEGPGIEILFDTPDLGPVSHFAVRAGGFDVTLPRLHETPEYGIAWFQIGETAHVLVSEDEHADPLLRMSVALSDTLY